jgi:hypothetical protein
MKHRVRLPHKYFLDISEFLNFFILFIVLLIVVFPKYSLLNILKNDNSKVTVKYLETLSMIYPNNNELVVFLVKKYINIGNYDKAWKLVKKIKSKYYRDYYSYLIVKYFFFQKKATIFTVKKYLKKFAYFLSYKDTAKIIYKEALAFNFYDLAFKAAFFVNKKSYINLAIYLKKYDLAILTLKKELKENYNEEYFIKLLDLALYTKNYKLAYKEAKKYYIFARSEKAYEKVLIAALHSKDKDLVEYSMSSVKNKDLLLQAYLFLRDYKNALKIAKEKKDIHLIAQIYLWSGNYKKAYKYFIKDGFNKNKKIIYSLASILHKNKTLIELAKEKVLKGDYSQIALLTNAYLEKAEFKKAEKFYWKMYRKRRLQIFLNELFKIYYSIGDIKRLKEVAWKFKHLSLDKAMYMSEIYISDRNYKKAYLLLKRVKSKKYGYYQRMYYLASQLGYKKAQKIYLLKMNRIKKIPYAILALYEIYKNEDLKKAYKFLRSNYYPNKFMLYALLESAYKLKKYKFIVQFKTKLKPKFYYTFVINAYKHLRNYKNEKRIYLQAIKRYPDMRKDFYWFLISNNDKDIKYYLHRIKDKKILLSAYMLLGYKRKAIRIVKYLAKKENSVNLWIQYYFLTKNKREKYWIYKKIDKLVFHNKKLLLNKDVLNFYFYPSLKYKPDYEIRRLLSFIKRHHLDYKKYYAIYLDYKQAFDKIKYLKDRYENSYN